MNEDARKEIIYIGDPLCSWCYGFSPVVQKLFAKHKDQAKMTLVVGGLHVGDNCIQTPERIAFLRDHWQEIGERTGQPFKFDILEEEGRLYDTEPPCRAVVAMRKLNPGAEFPFFAAVQAGFYAENRDSNADQTYGDAAREFGVDEKQFLDIFNDPSTREETMKDFHWSREIGISGFPAMLVRDAQGYRALTLGYQPLEALEKPLEAWLNA